LFSREYTILFDFFAKSSVNPNGCAIISPLAEKCGLNNEADVIPARDNIGFCLVFVSFPQCVGMHN